jgi:hypothetical protein
MSDHRNDLGATHRAARAPKAGPKLSASVPRRSTTELVLDCTGFFVGLFIMTADYAVPGPWRTAQNWEFLKSPKGMVWIFFVAGQFAFWASIIEPLWRWRSRLRVDYGLGQNREFRLKLLAAIVFFALPGVFLVHIVPDSNLAHHDLKLMLVNLVAIIVALVAVTGIWYVRAALEATFAGKGSGGRSVRTLQEGVDVLLDLRAYLQRFITLLGAMVALATLAKGALRQAILSTGGDAVSFPTDYVLLQGAYFTGLLALVYIPTYTILAAIGADLIDSAYPVTGSDLDWDNLSHWQTNRKSLEELLEVGSGAVHNLRASVSILAPAASSVIAVLLGTK